MIQVKYIANTGGTIVGDDTQYLFTGGTTDNVTATPDDGYYFLKWTDNTATADRTDSPVVDTTYVAVFYKITPLTKHDLLLSQYSD